MKRLANRFLSLARRSTVRAGRIAAGLTVETLYTWTEQTSGLNGWVEDHLRESGFEAKFRGEQIFCLARKTGSNPIDRYPDWLYASA